jgi:uncharacterized repeat protein (TIGR03803 family)
MKSLVESLSVRRTFRTQSKHIVLTFALLLFSAFAATPATGVENVLYSFTPTLNGLDPQVNVCLRGNAFVYGTAWGGGTGGQGMVYRVDKHGRQTVLHNFTGGPDGGYSWGSVLCGDDNIYGTTSGGGSAGAGVVWRLDDNDQFSVLYSFTGGADGGVPFAGLTSDPYGNLYGITCSGGASGQGVIFKLDQKANETVLYSFTGGADGGCPGGSSLARDGAGTLYGAAFYGGSGAGVIFKLDRKNNFTVVYSFSGGNDGNSPNGVAVDSAGNLYGTTLFGGTAGAGVLFKIDGHGNETVLYSFTGAADGGYPLAAPALDGGGNLYGAASGGGTANWGTLFKLDAHDNYTVLYTFTGGHDGGGPQAGLVRDAAGNLYGPASSGGDSGLGAVFKLDPLNRESVLYGFPATDGSGPQAGIIRDAAGNSYGTTTSGGVNNAGTVFKIDSNDKKTTIFTFTGGADGGYPVGGVIQDVAGNLYGTTQGGGSSSVGVVFKLDQQGHETVLYNFTGGPDGAYPNDVIMDSAGNLYGMTQGGGSSGVGVVFKLDTMGHETVLHTFMGTDGAYPYTGVTMDSAGNIYGATSQGGPGRWGVVYKLDPAQNYTMLHAFTLGADGGIPWGSPIVDAAGNVYGTTWSGGPPSGDYPGVVYKVDAGGHFSLLYTFTGFADGGGSRSNLVMDSAGNLYGTTQYGGQGPCPYFGCGVLFELDPNGHQTVLYSFTGGADGSEPGTGLVRDASGNLYGTTASGGTSGAGVVYQVAPGAGSLALEQPVQKPLDPLALPRNYRRPNEPNNVRCDSKQNLQHLGMCRIRSSESQKP